MRMFKFLAAMIAVLAFSVLGVTAAVAAPVPWQFLPGSKGETFKGELDEKAGNPKLQEQKEGKPGGTIVCKTFTIAAKGGELTGPKTTDSERALAIGTFTGCEAAGLAANSKGDTSGTILVHLELETCLIESEKKAKQDGVLILPLEVVIEVGKKPFTTILDTTNSGFIAPIAKIGANQYLINATQKEGKQTVTKCEGGEEESLKTLLAGATKEENAAEEAQVLIKFEKTIDTTEEVLA